MAAVSSLGLHQPAALSYLVEQGLLPPDPPRNAYTWQIIPDDDADGDEFDEILSTDCCVVWSRGGIVRTSYRFEVEKEPVAQALITYFLTDDNRPKTTRTAGNEPASKSNTNSGLKGKGKQRSKALVVILKTQAHVYFLAGTSHVIHLPFEVECAIPAPNGLILQRKIRKPIAAASLKFPRVPPTSFVSSQRQPWSSVGSQQSTFSVASLGAPKQLPFPSTLLLGNMWEPPTSNSDSNWPRLFSLTDPLADIGLIVTRPSDSPRSNMKRGAGKSNTLDPAEEIVYVSTLSELKCLEMEGDEPPMLAITWNRESGMFSFWSFSYLHHEPLAAAKRRATSGSSARRRSSYAPGPGTGTSTPITSGQYPRDPRDSFGMPGLANPKTRRRDKDASNAELDMAAALDPDFDKEALPRRQSRRVSSMLARSDLASSNDRLGFSELGGGQPHGIRRGDSIAGQHGRTSFGGHTQSQAYTSALNQSISSLLEAPVDDLLEDLRAGGDFEGFHNLGLDDNEFEHLQKEVTLTKINDVSAQYSNVRYSTQDKPAQSQCKVFTVTSPPAASVDENKANIVVCILDPAERKLLVVTLGVERQIRHKALQIKGKSKQYSRKGLTITWNSVTRAAGVLDACRISDGDHSRILVLTETDDGVGELSLQSPWSDLVKVLVPPKLNISNVRSLGDNGTPRRKREAGLKRVLSEGPVALSGLLHSVAHGIFDLLDVEGRLHQLQLHLQPRDPNVNRIINVCRTALAGPRGGEGILVGWWNVMQWLAYEDISGVDREWTALTITLFALVVGSDDNSNFVQPPISPLRHKPRRSFGRASSGSMLNTENWNSMLSHEALDGSMMPPWMQNRGWKWIAENDEIELKPCNPVTGMTLLSGEVAEKHGFISRHVKLTQAFLQSAYGDAANGSNGYLPTAAARKTEVRKQALADIILALHLLREECKLDVTSNDFQATSASSFLAILAQMSRWLHWDDWIAYYGVENSLASSVEFDSSLDPHLSIPQPFLPPSALDWVQVGLVSMSPTPFLTIRDIATKSLGRKDRSVKREESWTKLTPRTAMFAELFHAIEPKLSSPEFVELLFSKGFDSSVLDTLPEAVVTPLREAIGECQNAPPTNWDKALLSLVGREDVNALLYPEKRITFPSSSLLAPTHTASMDVGTICLSTNDSASVGAFDGSAEVDRQSVTRLIFKDDRRVGEASKILNTNRPTVERIRTEAHWSESDILEAQKEYVHLLAYRTLAIPSGRGLLNFSARVPLLTERFPISGFNLHVVMKPTNTTVGVDKNLFTEEKVCWAFFHSGVSAGLSISRATKGIDTSWILYNKPPELTNRHAGFLLALGLNGHLKSIAKWVAFKYLTPKHTMTSIGLLLGLAASFLGTMDSLITRLLSVHVTRMLPPGAAELNLSPLTQTTGIMGIGLLYANTQHRRMSEIMLSEIEHLDPELEEEPLRNEGYRLAAGFALGFINLGKGTDLKGLQDMKLMDRLTRLAVGTKKVTLVHVLDKTTAAAVVATALIYMKSEDQVLARKIDVPPSIQQFDYVRPDIFMLRTIAKHLIMWNEIDATPEWVQSNLPDAYQARSTLKSVRKLSSEDMAFYDILTGLCFSIALRHAGSGSIQVRDLLLHYLDQMMRICSLPARNYDQQLTRSTVRNCQDLIALSAATVMAGRGDIPTFRRLRAMHGRSDPNTTYGSHLAAHLAIGALFLGGGTHTFGTSNIAIASLVVAFYPLFPTNILDNKCHLQAFRHFWVLATEPRCLVVRDIDTNRPISIPLIVTNLQGQQTHHHAPCLLPDLRETKSVTTDSPEYWNVLLDFANNAAHLASFKATQTIFVRRRPPHDSKTSAFQATLQALNDNSSTARHPLEWIFELPAFGMLSKAERALVLPPDNGSGGLMQAGMEGTVVDARLVLEKASLESGKRDRLLGLRMLFEWADRMQGEGREMMWIRREVVDRLKTAVWMRAEGEEER